MIKIKRREFIAGLGGAAFMPRIARAQQRPLPVIGYLNGGSGFAKVSQQAVAAFRRGLGELGYVEGRNVEILFRWADTHYNRLPALAADLVRRRVAVIAATGSATAALAAKSATATIPIVFTTGADPVEQGLVASLNRPGGNLTGAGFLVQELTAKRLELLHEIVPAAASIGFLVNPTNVAVQADMKEGEAAARILGVHLVIAKASTPSEIREVFAMLAGQQVGALAIGNDGLFAAQSDQLAELAIRYAMPTMHSREFVEAGGLMAYGADLTDAWHVAGTYAGRILKGEKPADLPVQQSTRFALVLNLKAAKALGLEVPTATLLRADAVIE